MNNGVAIMMMGVFLVGGLMGCAPASLGDRAGVEAAPTQRVSAEWLLADPASAPLFDRPEDIDLRVAGLDKVYHSDQEMSIGVLVKNLTGHAIRFEASTSSKFLVHIWRETPAGWTRVLTYPEADLQVVTPWGLKADGHYVALLSIPVQRDWPTYEPLRVTVTINGTDVSSAPVTIEVIPDES